MVASGLLDRFARLRAYAVGAALVAVSTAASAQVGLGNPSLGEPPLSQAAIDRMHAAVARLYQDRPVGSVETWSSPETGASGEVKLLRVFNYQNMPCRTIGYNIKTGAGTGPNDFTVSWCQVPGGAWKIAQVPAPG